MRALSAIATAITLVSATSLAAAAGHGHGHRHDHNHGHHTKRSHKARAEFQQQHTCPSTGRHSGSCPGYVIDHVRPLACGGADAPENMQWQRVADAKTKDKIERRGC